MASEAAQVNPSGTGIGRGTALNLAGQVVPLIVAVLCVPPLISKLGIDRFGLLTLAWAIVGYFSLFDLGLGRALTQLVSERLGTCRIVELPDIIRVAVVAMGGMGLIGAVVLGIGAETIATRLLNVPDALRVETIEGFFVLALAIPAVVLSGGLVGLLSSYQRFGVINAIRTPLGIINFAGPLLVVQYSSSLQWVFAILTLARVVSLFALFMACRQYFLTKVTGLSAVNFSYLGNMLKTGGWMTVSNVVGPLMVYMDRFVIGAFLSVAAVAYYATPYEVITKLWIVPTAVVGVLFPAFAAAAKADLLLARDLFRRGIVYILIFLFPIALFFIFFASQILTAWLDLDFARNSAPVMQWLAIGVLANGLAHVPFAHIQGVGRSDITAKLHLLELLLYLPILWWSLSTFGLIGAAIVWAGRSILDAIFLCLVSGHFLHESLPKKATVVAYFVGSASLFLIAMWPFILVVKAFVYLIVVAISAITFWRRILVPDEKLALLRLVRQVTKLG